MLVWGSAVLSTVTMIRPLKKKQNKTLRRSLNAADHPEHPTAGAGGGRGGGVCPAQMHIKLI